ncbi:MAG: hypothetical protein IJA12_04000 [Oscillospiraceae bacterium]|nr:hypothetical protein [Oscillospiraceae bacterium]
MTETSASEIFDLRNLYYYQSGNIFTGSLNGFNYKIIPDKENITALIWHGNLCSELAEIEQQKEFVLDENGFKEMINWLEDEYKKQI